MKVTARASEHGGYIVENTIRLGLIHKKLNVRVEEVTFGDMNSFHEPGREEEDCGE